MKASTVALKPSSGPSMAVYSMSWPVANAKAAWINGDLLWPMGLPMTA
ncbi:hypothetical protein Y695_04388 [Hydrogenophaga sp. T4]|nr:hypothetical protein Y695_04388 [Hydrogenophaga sp. T4]